MDIPKLEEILGMTEHSSIPDVELLKLAKKSLDASIVLMEAFHTEAALSMVMQTVMPCLAVAQRHKPNREI